MEREAVEFNRQLPRTIPTCRGAGRLPFLLLMLAVAGCGNSHEATVFGIADLDGMPLETGMVTFHPSAGGASAYGVLTEGGRYEIKTGDKRGLVPGKYYITVEATEPYEEGPPGATPRIPRTLSPSRYGNVRTTDLIETIEPGAHEINLTLKAKAAE